MAHGTKARVCLILSLGLVVLSVGCEREQPSSVHVHTSAASVSEPAVAAEEAVPAAPTLVSVASPTCGTDTRVHTDDSAHHGDRYRAAAQRGLTFLTEQTLAWQDQNKCFGCHVQGVTGQALAVGLSHQYDLNRASIHTVFRGINELNGGIRTTSGHAHPGGSLEPPSRAFGGAALARYDALVDNHYSTDLIAAANALVALQTKEGTTSMPYNNGVVARGDLQCTYQSIQTWQTAYPRPAAANWLRAIQRSAVY